uniref:Uncharacterized protein n=1 Tax=Globodera rostochiensis TaxID=31243 RepID=A0A914IGN2_GLORO
MHKNRTKTLATEELQRKSLERKIQKTATNLKAVERQLPCSFTKKDSRLVPSAVSTNTFKKGLTLHNILCDSSPCARQRPLNNKLYSKMGKRTLSQDNIVKKSKIAFYPNLGSTIMSSSAMDLFEQSFNINNGRATADWMIANVKKMFANGRTPTTEHQEAELDEVDEEDTSVNGHNESTETLVADLNQSVTELKQKLTNAVDIVDQMDRTLNESEGLAIESEDERRSIMPLTTNPMKAKSTQTAHSWRMNIVDPDPPLSVHKSAMPKMSSDLEESMRAECKELMRKHIETLREHMKVRVFLLHAKRKGLSSAEKKNGHEKFKALMDEFDEAKRKIKADFKKGGADKGVLAKHCVEIGQLQRETRWLQTKLEQILCSKNAAVTSQFSSMTNVRQSGPSPNAFNFVNMEKRTNFVEPDRNNSLDNFLLLGADTFSSGQKPPLSAISPQIPPLNFDQLSVSDVSCNEGLVVRNHPTPPPIEHTEHEEKQAEKLLSDGSMAAISSKAHKIGNVSESGFAHSSTSHKTVNDQKIDNESNELIGSRVKDEEPANGDDDNMSFSELTSGGGGNTSDDITSIPFPSEAGKVEEHLDGQTAAKLDDDVPTDEKKSMVFDGLNNGDGTPTSSRRFKFKVRMEEMAQVEASAHAHQMGTELHYAVHNSENAAQNEQPVVDEGLDDDAGDDQTERTEETQSELADSVFEEPTENSSTADERGGTGRGRSSNSFDAAKEEEEVEVISAKSLGRTLSLTQRTLAEIESIPEEMSPNDYAESAPKSASVMSEKVDDLQKTEDSITEEISEDVAFSFKPSEKSLRSILSVRSNSVSTSARDSLGKLRRDSASEALVKLRTMNSVPELRSPRESKSPPKPLKSPRGVERFMAKFPNNSSRETSFSEEHSVKGEMLEELPNTSQLGMLFELSCASADGTLSKLDSSSDSKRRQSGNAFNIAGMDKRADSVDPRKMERRDSLSNFNVPEVCTAGVKARAEKTSHVQLDANRILLAQYVYAHLSNWPTQEMLMETDIEIINGL